MSQGDPAGPEVRDDARLRMALSYGDLAVWEYDFDRNEITHSPELNRLYGYPPDARPSVDEFVARYAPGEAERVDRLIREAAARGETRLNLEIRHLWPDGTVKWLGVRAEATPGPGRQALGVVIDITDRKLAEEAMQQSERRFRLSQQAAGIAALELEVSTGDMIVSDNFWSLWGMEPRPKLNIADLQNIILPDSRGRTSTEADRRSGTTTPRIEFQIRRPDTGEVRWLARDIEFQRDESGTPVRMFGVIRDITVDKIAEERQALLTHELQHRIKNILATVSALAAQTLRGTDLPAARDTFMSRLRALSEAHSILTGTHWTDASMRSIVDAALAPHEIGDRVGIAGGDVLLGPRMALSLALAVNELVTNALKYGALTGPLGVVHIAWSVVPDELNGNPEMVWTWRESGGPAVSPPSRRGFGSVLIERVLAADFGGTVLVDFAATGLVVTLRFPVANLPTPSASK